MRRIACLTIAAVCLATAVADDLALYEWRLEKKNATATAEKASGGRSPVIRVRYPSAKPGERGSVSFSTHDLRHMMDSWIPPYVGESARRIELDVNPVRASDGCHAHFFCRTHSREVNPRQEYPIDFQMVKTNEWKKLVFPVELGAGDWLGEIGLAFDGAAGGTCEVLVAGVRVITDDGRGYDVVNAESPDYMRMAKTPRCAASPCRVPRRQLFKFGCTSEFLMSDRSGFAEVSAFMKKYLPGCDVMFSVDFVPPPSAADHLRDLPENIFFQFQKGQHDLRYARLHNALVKDQHGRPQHIMFNSSVATHPVLRHAFEDQMRYLGSIGFNSVQQYDYVWMYPDGVWGFDDATTAAFREDLVGADEGLTLSATADGEPERTIRFWEYYRDYLGDDPVTPKELGLADWYGYRPKFDAARSDRERRLYRLLVNYEWLRQGQRFGRWAQKHCHGGQFDFLLNGEGHWNGNDHVYLTRLKSTGRVYPEFFDGTPQCLEMIYRTSGSGLRNARRYGKTYGVTLETSTGGGGSQPYWSEKAGYVIAYALSALGYQEMEYDGTPVSGSWEKESDRENVGPFHCLSLGMAEARGFRQAKVDGARRPAPSGTFFFTERCVGQLEGGSLSYTSGMNGQKEDFRGELCDAQIDFDTTDPQDFPLVAARAKTIFLSPLVTRKDVHRRLRQWERDAPDRRLVTELGTVEKVAQERGLNRMQRDRASREAFVLPFETAAANVAVVVNRKGASHDGYDKWIADVWSKAPWRQKYNYGDLLFKDKIPGADVTVVVPVGRDGAYRIWKAVGGRESVVRSQNGQLELRLGDDFANLFYYGIDTDAFRRFLAERKTDMELTSAFFEKGKQSEGIVSGEIWPDNNGVHVNAHGGGVLEESGVYWWYGEDKIAGRAGNNAHTGVHVYSSRNLVDWRDEGLALDVRGYETGDLAGVPEKVERPKVLRSRTTGKYVMYFHLVRKGEDYYNSRVGIAVADAPKGPFRFVKSVRPNPGRWPLNARPEDCTEEAVRTWSAYADWTMPDWSEKTLAFIRNGNFVAAHFRKGQLAQDQTLFRDDDGRSYHVYASEFDATMHIAELRDDLLDYTGRYWRAFAGTWTEAPALCKRNGWYYLLGSGCSGWKPNAARVYRARSLAGPWEALGNPCRGVNPQNGLGPEKTWGCQSTFILPAPGRPGEFIAMFDMWRPENAIDGRYVWLPIAFDADGRMSITWTNAWHPF